MAKIVILGAGVMGSAMTVPLIDQGHDVNLVGTHLDSDIIREIRSSGVHPRLRTRIPEGVAPYQNDELETAMQGVDLVLLGVNSLGIDWAAGALGPVLAPEVPVIAVTKGLEADGQRIHLLPDVLQSGLPASYRDDVQVAAIGGPAIAAEVAARRHTCVVFTGRNPALLDKLARVFRNPYYHIWTSTDIVGVEVAVALKNLYALAVGLTAGFLEKEGETENGAAMHNLAAAVFAQGLRETAYLVDYLGGRTSSVYTLPGAGDFYVTCQGGRNGRMGRWLGLGLRYSDAKAEHMPDETVEGAELARVLGPTIETLVRHGELDGVNLPLLRTVVSIVTDDAPAEIPWDDFFAGIYSP